MIFSLKFVQFCLCNILIVNSVKSIPNVENRRELGALIINTNVSNDDMEIKDNAILNLDNVNGKQVNVLTNNSSDVIPQEKTSEIKSQNFVFPEKSKLQNHFQNFVLHQNESNNMEQPHNEFILETIQELLGTNSTEKDPSNTFINNMQRDSFYSKHDLNKKSSMTQTFIYHLTGLARWFQSYIAATENEAPKLSTSKDCLETNDATGVRFKKEETFQSKQPIDSNDTKSQHRVNDTDKMNATLPSSLKFSIPNEILQSRTERQVYITTNSSDPPLKFVDPCSEVLKLSNINASLYSSMKQKFMSNRTLKDAGNRLFADKFYKYLVDVEKLQKSNVNINKLRLSALVNKDYMGRLHMANKQMVDDLLLNLKSTQTQLERQKDDCLLTKTLSRYWLIHRISSLLILSLPWSIEDILNIEKGERFIDNVFRPQSKSIFDAPCLECYKKLYGECKEIFLCRQGSSITSLFPPPLVFP